jgi:Uma2 family endonuclease
MARASSWSADNGWSGIWELSPIGWPVHSQLDRFSEEHGLGWALSSESGYQCFPHEPGRVCKPDVSFVRHGRFPGGVLLKGWAKVRPDLAVEIVSPNDMANEIDVKLADYEKVESP